MITIRPMECKDLDMVASIEKENFTRPWSQNGFADSAFREDTIYLVAQKDEVVVGYVGMWISLDEGEITNVSVAKWVQGLGIGRMLMEQLLLEARQKNVHRCILEVRVSNQPAVHLYESIGFASMGVRKNFYEAPTEDGIVMGKELT